MSSGPAAGAAPPVLSSVLPLPALFRVWCDPGLAVLTSAVAAASTPAVAARPAAAVGGAAGGGVVLLGGSPLRLMTLSAAGARVFAALQAGCPVGEAGPGAGMLARRLVDAGLLHPLPPTAPAGAGNYGGLTGIIPVRDGAAQVGALVAALREVCDEVIVVDDGSVDDTAAVARAAGARVVCHAAAQGPAAARTAGAAAARTGLVVFCDGDVLPTTGWLDRLLAHLGDPAGAAVAPRVASPVGAGTRAGLRERYEAACSPLDLGGRPGAARAGSRVPYVPTAALLIRRDQVAFDPALRYGEDVDLVWRLIAAGQVVRYEPAAVVNHRPRTSWPAWLRQRYGYGSSAAALAGRHPGLLRPARGPALAVAAVGLLAARRDVPVLGAIGVLTALSVAVTARRLDGQLGHVERPTATVVALTVRVRRRGLLAAAEGVRRTWLPVVAAAGRPGRVVLAAAVLPLVSEWWSGSAEVGLLPYVGLRLADDAAYCAGLWAGCLAAGSAEPLLPARPNWLSGSAGRRLAGRWLAGRRPPTAPVV